MEHNVVCFLSLVLLNFPADLFGYVVVPSMNPLAVGQNVTLNLAPQSFINIGTWSHESTAIVIFYPNGESVAKPYTGRVKFNRTSLELSIRSLQLNDSGQYIIQGIDPDLNAAILLSVQEPISNVTLRAKSIDLVELNDTAVLTCSTSSGSSLSYRWLNGSSVVTASGVIQIGEGTSTLTLNRVTRFDKGPFRCEVFNGISNNTSQPIHLNVRYGPSNLTVMVIPKMPLGHAAYRTGSNITLSCSAQSYPAASYMWKFNGAFLDSQSPQLTLQNIRANQTGNYTCLAHNNITLRFAILNTIINIVEPITMVELKPTKFPILNESFTLRCVVTGPVDYIRWKMDGQPFPLNNRTINSVDNNTINITSIQFSDRGKYQCEAFNAVSNLTSMAYTLVVNYGPEMPIITGPALGETGHRLTFNCSASSQPPSQFSWFYNGSLVAIGSVYETGPLTLASQGVYTCVAFNNVTGRNNTAPKMLTVVASISSVTITTSGNQAIEGNFFAMTCNITGEPRSIQWWKNRILVHLGNRTNTSMDNRILSFNPVQQSDQGEYQCMASNDLSNRTSRPYTLIVNYGPEQPIIVGLTVAETGHRVTFNCSASSQPPSQFSWFYNGSQVANGSVYETGPLTLTSQGLYTCVAFNNVTGRNNTASKMLTVVAPISSVTITTSGNQAIEGNFFAMTCNITGEPRSIQWWKNHILVHLGNRTNTSMNNRILSFNPVQQSDQGEYQCMAINDLSNRTSRPYTLIVNYGPEQPIIVGLTVAETGHRVTFNCSASSQPPSQFSWFYNGSQVANGSVYETGPLTLTSQGLYTCVAFNNVTGRNNTTSKMLTVVGTKNSVKPSTIPIASDNLTLTCEVIGPYDTIYWLKNSLYLDLNNTLNSDITITNNNHSLNFVPVKVSNDGNYQCVTTNHFGPHPSPEYQLQVNYGPQGVNISVNGPTKNGTEFTITMTCSANSRPTSEYHWKFNNQSVPTTGPLLVVVKSVKNTGNYTCLAVNSVTRMVMSKTISLDFTDHSAAPTIQYSVGLMLIVLSALCLLSD